MVNYSGFPDLLALKENFNFETTKSGFPDPDALLS